MTAEKDKSLRGAAYLPGPYLLQVQRGVSISGLSAHEPNSTIHVYL